MELKDFIREGKVRKASVDRQLVKSLLKISENDLNYIKTLKINEESRNSIFVLYYEALRKIVEAIAILDGYKVYSHEAFTSLLKVKGDDIIANKFDRYRKLRNGINYFGKEISVSEVEVSVIDILKIIKYLRNKYLRDNLSPVT